MPKAAELASKVYIRLDGSDVEPSVMQKLVGIIVDQHVHLPDMFTIRFHDGDLDLMDNGPFDLTKKVEIKAAKEGGEKVTLIKGEITALEPDFTQGMIAELVVRGYDESHRLYREQKSVAHLNKKDSDLASEVARTAGLKSQIDSTSTVYDHVFQHNQSDLDMLMRRAWRIGYECFVDEGTLYFRKPPSGDASVTLTWGVDLLSFRPRMTLAEQLDQVVVKGWDVEAQQPIVGRAEKGDLYPKVGESKDGASWAQPFGTGKQVILDQEITSQAEADTLAAARLNEISGVFIEAEGVAFRRPDIKAGKKVKLEALGNRFSGTYLVTNAMHVYTPEGLETTFFVRGSRKGLVTEQISTQPTQKRWPSVVIAVVTNTDDPKDWGRVKVKYPWMTEDAESDWARVVGVGAGPEAGFFVIPEVGDEVLVCFAHGNFGQPFVLGGLWNGKHTPPPEAAQASGGEKPLVRTWHSRSGHYLVMHDDSANKVEIKTAGGQTITLDDQNQKMELTSGGELKITMDRDITIEGKANFNIKTTGNVNYESQGNMTLKGTQITLEGTAAATLKAPTVTIDGSAAVNVTGALIKLN